MSETTHPTPGVEPEEAQAIMDLMGSAAAHVVERDFRRPLRLGTGAFAELRRSCLAHLPAIEASLAEALCATHALELEGLSETTAEGLFDELRSPFCVLRFDVGGQMAWIVWEIEAAVVAVGKILGSTAEPEQRRLSRVERRVLADVLGRVASGFGTALGIEVGSGVIAQTIEDVGSWRDAGERADPHRLVIELAFDGPGAASRLALYLPGFGGEAAVGDALLEALTELPAHLRSVEIEVSARIEGCEVPLNQLLSLEQGDVIPLDARLGDPALVAIEGRPFARGRLGTHRGHLAVRIEHLERDEEALG